MDGQAMNNCYPTRVEPHFFKIRWWQKYCLVKNWRKEKTATTKNNLNKLKVCQLWPPTLIIRGLESGHWTNTAPLPSATSTTSPFPKPLAWVPMAARYERSGTQANKPSTASTPQVFFFLVFLSSFEFFHLHRFQNQRLAASNCKTMKETPRKHEP